MFTKSRPSASMIVAVVALVLSCAGTGYAASTISGKVLKKRSVPSDRIVSNSLTGLQINENQLGIVPQAQNAQVATLAKQADMAKEADHAKAADTAKTADTATSAKLADDSKLLQGKPAAAFLSNDIRVRSANGPVVPGPAGGTPSSAQANCLATEKGIGGGGGWYITAPFNEPTELPAFVTAGVPVVSGAGEITGWQIHGRNQSGADRYMRAYVLCVPKTA